jgi:predicted amidohydrolase
MSRTLNIAAIQMDVTPAPTTERLTRAERLIDQAAQDGAQLVVLPEVFNTGYAYVDDNHRRAEPIDGPTVTWMKATAARCGIHLVGTLMLLENTEVYNAMVLVAPDGRMWRYDKNYPWGWERGYFRGAERITIAKTDLGDFGMLICWDVAHSDLWRRYAGRVDMMLICSSPPDFSNAVFHFPDGARVSLEAMGPVMGSLRDSGQRIFGETIDQQVAWLQVPAVNTMASGTFKSPVPNGRLALLAFIPLAPWLVQYFSVADQMVAACDMVEGNRVLNAQGRVLASLSQAQGEGITMAQINLADKKPRPQGAQPPPPVPWLSFFVADVVLPLTSLSIYRRGLRRAWGETMAPRDAKTRRWLPLVGAVALATATLIAGVGVWIGMRLRHKE